jgi:hypothetical protein
VGFEKLDQFAHSISQIFRHIAGHPLASHDDSRNVVRLLSCAGDYVLASIGFCVRKLCHFIVFSDHQVLRGLSGIADWAGFTFVNARFVRRLADAAGSLARPTAEHVQDAASQRVELAENPKLCAE